MAEHFRRVAPLDEVRHVVLAVLQDDPRLIGRVGSKPFRPD